MKITLIGSTLLLILGSNALAQSTFRLRNSTWQDFLIDVQQSGMATVPATEYELHEDTSFGWWDDEPVEIFTCNRSNASVADGDTAILTVRLMGNIDTLQLKMRLIGQSSGTAMQFAISGPGIDQPWSDNPDFQEVQTTLAGKQVIVKYRPDNNDTEQQRNVFFTIHDLPIYEIDEEDFNDPNVMNAMFYNIQMLPFGVSGMGQANDRAALLPAQISPYQDVVCFAEIFDDSPREDHLIPAMTAAGFPYRTEVLNPNNSIIPLPWNGGVMFFSRWPIEIEDDYDFELCGQESQDCLAAKGIKYARVNKLGKRYHLFGTHMDAGGQEDDILAKRTQMAEMRMFIDAQNIPDGEPVIFGGDFNVAPTHGENLYNAMLDSIGPYVPDPIGYHNSTWSGPFGKIIDNAWGDKSHLVATSATNEVITMRSLEPVLWELGEFSDHRAALGRFVYPDITMEGQGDTVLCTGASFEFAINANIAVDYQWMLNGEELAGQTAAMLNVTNAIESQSGQYSCAVSYEVIYGAGNDALTAVFYPNGADTVRSTFIYDFGEITISQQLCEVGVQEMSPAAFRMFPNPSAGIFTVSLMHNTSTEPHLEVVDLTGRVVHQQPFSGNTVSTNLTSQPNGMYMIRVISGQYVQQQRIAIVR